MERLINFFLIMDCSDCAGNSELRLAVRKMIARVNRVKSANSPAARKEIEALTSELRRVLRDHSSNQIVSAIEAAGRFL